jgi:hypothetical protein
MAALRTICLFALLCTAALPACADERTPPDLVLNGTLNGDDHQTYRLVPFDVPAGTTRITVDFDYTTRDVRTTIDLGVLGPDGFRGQDGFRGWSGGNKRSFTISATDATPSYLPGAIRPGQWNLLLGVPNIRRDTRATYTATVRFEREGTTSGTRMQQEVALRSQPGWYRGDLHMHTAHSDGSCASQRGERVPCPLFLTARTASERGLDFIAITEHNTFSHADSIRELQPYFDNLLLIPGREITTFQGHANLFGNAAQLDFRVSGGDVPDWNSFLANVERSGGAVISINHPVRPSGEQCMGCGWTPRGNIDYAHLQAVEVVNGLDADTPYSGIPFWESLLVKGYRLAAIGGSDNHDALLPVASSGAIGTPTTVIYADALSQAAIVAGMKRGRVFIDVAGTRDRALDLTAKSDKQTANMGDLLVAPRGGRIRFEGAVTGVSGGEIEIIVDGRRMPLLKNARIDSATASFDFEWHADGKRHWLRLNVRDEAGHLVLIGNPIYLR